MIFTSYTQSPVIFIFQIAYQFLFLSALFVATLVQTLICHLNYYNDYMISLPIYHLYFNSPTQLATAPFKCILHGTVTLR